MSYHFYVKVDTGGAEPHFIEPFFDDVLPMFDEDGMAGTAVVTETGYARCGNYTSNVSGIWARCLTAATDRLPAARKWIGRDEQRLPRGMNVIADMDRRRLPEVEERLCLRDLHGLECGELAPLLALAVEWGAEHIEELREENPENGWGSAEGAVTYLWDIQRTCEQHPAGYLEISS